MSYKDDEFVIVRPIGEFVPVAKTDDISAKDIGAVTRYTMDRKEIAEKYGEPKLANYRIKQLIDSGLSVLDISEMFGVKPEHIRRKIKQMKWGEKYEG